MRTVLIIGGYGVFGGRIAHLLGSDPSFQILVAGRSLSKAELFCKGLGKPNIRPIRLDRNQGLENALGTLAPWLVIDATGPFQNMTGGDYPVALASIRAGAHYIDIADARAFVEGIGTLDTVAQERGVTAISGASSVPALSSAIVEHLGAGMRAIIDIDIALSASNRATVGDNVIHAILSYVGKPIPAWQQAREGIGYGWQSLRRRDFRIPGRRPLERRLLGLCDVPDIRLLPRRHPDCRSVVFRAGAELWHQNLFLWLLSWPVRWCWIDSLAPLSGFIGHLQRRMRFLGSDRSAMETRILGQHDTGAIERRHTIIAESGDGPWIPCLPAALLAKKLAQDAASLPAGAYPAVAVLQMDDFEKAFADFDIHCAATETRIAPLYARILQSGLARLPAPIRDMHDYAHTLSATGTASVECGGSLIARLCNRIFGFPSKGTGIPVRVDFMPDEHGETWQRRFGGSVFFSRLTAGRRPGRIIERFGWVSFGFQLVVSDHRLSMLLSDWRLWKLPLPRFLAPRIEATETVENGLFTFNVRIDLPLGIKLVHYRGSLMPSR